MFRIFTLVIITIFASLNAHTTVLANEKQKSHTARKKAKPDFDSNVFLIRGGFDIFSGGLNILSEKLAQKGVPNNVIRHTGTKPVIQSLVKQKKGKKQDPVIIIGHSWGADQAIKMAEELRKAGITVNYIATFAATAPVPIPNNVEKMTNFYFKTNGWGKIVKRGTGFHGKLENINLSTQKGIDHFNIDEQPDLQEKVIEQVLKSFKTKKG